MLEILDSNNPSNQSNKKNLFFNKFIDFLSNSTKACLTTGFVSEQSLLFLNNNVKVLPLVNIYIGMFKISPFSQGQLNAITKLNNSLIQNKKGEIYISTNFPFHGKVYTFQNGHKYIAGIVGSSNMTCIDPRYKKTFEIDVAFNDTLQIKELVKIQNELILTNSIKFINYKFRGTFPTQNTHLKDNFHVEYVGSGTYKKNYSSSKKIFNIILKCTPKSNLNCFHGKGRLNTLKGYTLPRPWYEVEIIVPKIITSQTGFPVKKEFTVITDDGFKFECKTSGDYSKNLRSKGDLQILGYWIKGRLEDKGLISIGDLIDEDHLKKYGKNKIELISTNSNDLFLLNFKP
jgi:hypothetical protein